jgi:hypothetical protein
MNNIEQKAIKAAPHIWSDALREQNFAAIADWFTNYFFFIGAVVLIAAGLAAGADKFATEFSNPSTSNASAVILGVGSGLRVFVFSFGLRGSEYRLRVVARIVIRNSTFACAAPTRTCQPKHTYPRRRLPIHHRFSA